MEVMACEVHGFNLGIGYLDADRMCVLIELAANLGASVGCGGGDELDTR